MRVSIRPQQFGQVIGRQAITRGVFVAGLLILVAVLAQLIATNKLNPIFIFAALAAAAGGVALYKLGRFEYGFLAIALTASLVNFFTLPTGRESRIVISLAITVLMLGLWGLQLLFHRGPEPRLKPSPVNIPLLAFVAVNIIAYVWGMLMRDPLVRIWPSFPNVQLAALLVNIGLPLLSLMVANKITEVRWLRYLVWIIIGIGTFAVISELLALPWNTIYFNGIRGVFSMWAAALCLALALFENQRPLWQRVLLLAVCGLWFYRNLILTTVWLSGWIPLLITCAIVVFIRSRKLFAVLSVIGLALVAINFTDYYNRVVVSNEEEGSTSRLDIWSLNLGHVANHPIFGMGPAGYAVYNMHYHPQDARSTHSNWFDLLAQNGIVGVISFVVMAAAFIRVGVSNVRATYKHNTFEAAFSATTLAGIFGALIAMTLGDWVLPFAYNQTITGFDNACYTWMLLGGMVSLYLIRLRRDRSELAPSVAAAAAPRAESTL
jgi:O-antigen ligase